MKHGDVAQLVPGHDADCAISQDVAPDLLEGELG